jgi:hypothetical protein
MANRYAVQSGNWSDTATWDGGTLPVPGDVVRPNNFIVGIDQDINVAELRNDASSPAVAGGSFRSTVPFAGRRTGIGNVINAAATVLLLDIGKWDWFGNLTGGTSSTARAQFRDAVQVDWYGTFIQGAAGAAALCRDISQVRLFGDATGCPTATTAQSAAIATLGNTRVQVFGDAVGGTGDNSAGVTISGSAVTGITIWGRPRGGAGANSPGVRMTSSAAKIQLYVFNDTISHVNGSPGIFNEGTATVAVQGTRDGIIHSGGGKSVQTSPYWLEPFGDFLTSIPRFVTTAVTPRSIIGSWTINGTHIPVDSLTVDIKDFAFNSVIGGPQAMTRDDTDPRLVSFEHGSNIFSRNNQYFLIFGGSYDGQALNETIHPIRF